MKTRRKIDSIVYGLINKRTNNSQPGCRELRLEVPRKIKKFDFIL